jgi:hypothetical protein
MENWHATMISFVWFSAAFSKLAGEHLNENAGCSAFGCL